MLCQRITGIFRRTGGSRLAACGLVGALALLNGCFRPAPPKLNLERPAPPAAALEIAPYLEAARYGEWVYERVELDPDGDRHPTRYVRRVTADRLSEGFLSHRALPALERYLQAGEGRGPATRPAPSPLPAREAPHFFELVEPMPAIPADVSATQPASGSTSLRYYNRRGRLEMTGTLTRSVRLEGTQEVEVPAGRFSDCLRLRVELRIDFRFGPTIDWNSYIWLSREAGEVRRIEEFSGALWIFGFGSAHEYRLVSYSRAKPPVNSKAVDPAWRTGLITLDRPVPRPRISGMVIDFAASQPAE